VRDAFGVELLLGSGFEVSAIAQLSKGVENLKDSKPKSKALVLISVSRNARHFTLSYFKKEIQKRR
jgi:hypothetical protein